MKTNDTFKSRYIGPYIVVKVISDVVVSIKHYENEVAQPFTINIDRLFLVQKRKEHLMENPAQPVLCNSEGARLHPSPKDSPIDEYNTDDIDVTLPPPRYNLRPRKK